MFEELKTLIETYEQSPPHERGTINAKRNAAWQAVCRHRAELCEKYCFTLYPDSVNGGYTVTLCHGYDELTWVKVPAGGDSLTLILQEASQLLEAHMVALRSSADAIEVFLGRL